MGQMCNMQILMNFFILSSVVYVNVFSITQQTHRDIVNVEINPKDSCQHLPISLEIIYKFYVIV